MRKTKTFGRNSARKIYSRWFSLHQKATAFQADVAAILVCVAGCLKKKLFKEQIIIFSDSEVAITALGASMTRSLLAADCMERLTALSEKNRASIVWTLGYSSIAQIGTADELTKKETRTKPTGLEPNLPPSQSRYKSKMKNWLKDANRWNGKPVKNIGPANNIMSNIQTN